MFIDPLVRTYRDVGELVALCGPTPSHLDYCNERLEGELGYRRVPTYSAANFDEMVDKTKPDTGIVTTTDAFLHKYVIRAMELGCDAVTEKPMTIDDEKHPSGVVPGQKHDRGTQWTSKLRVLPMFGEPYELRTPVGTGGGHGGANPLI